jgi:dTDP-D-glucose 4,6-dehydratase
MGMLTDYGYDVTNKITEALRVKENDLDAIKRYLSRHGVADWVLDNPQSFVRTNYVPTGTLLDLKKVSI